MTTVTSIAEKRTKTKVAAKRWAEIEAVYETGDTTLSELSKKYKLGISTIQRHFDIAGIKKGSRKAEMKARVAEELTKTSITDATILAARIRETKEEHYKLSSHLAKLIWAEVIAARTSGSPMAVATNNLKALNVAADGLRKVREERWVVLGLDRPDAIDPGELPDLQVSVLGEDEIKEMRERDLQDDFDMSGAVQNGSENFQSDEDDADDDEDDGVVSEGD